MLHGRAFRTVTNFTEHLLPAVAPGLDTDLDELVRRKRAVDFCQHGSGETLVADQNHRFECMGAGLQRV